MSKLLNNCLGMLMYYSLLHQNTIKFKSKKILLDKIVKLNNVMNNSKVKKIKKPRNLNLYHLISQTNDVYKYFIY